MTEKKVHSTINAFEMALYVKVSSKLRAQYKLQDKNFDRISQYAKAEKAEELAEGEAKGLAEGKIEVAKKMYVKGFPLEDVADCTGLSIEEIKKLIDSV